jgi:ElaB/YqjD/DUF883 family membrane-anchored ribosome-binding protein
MDNETEVIKTQMLETRTALTEKLEALEDRVTTTVKETTQAVEDTVGAVKDAVEDTVSTVKETVQGTVETMKETVNETVDTVKTTFDIHHQFAERPWLMLGGAVVVGYLGSTLLQKAGGNQTSSNGWAPIQGHHGQPEERSRPAEAPQASSSEPSMWDKAVDAFGPAISKLEELAIGAAAGVIGKMILNAAPDALRGQLGDVINDLTTGLGGKPQPGLMRPDEPTRTT